MTGGCGVWPKEARTSPIGSGSRGRVTTTSSSPRFFRRSQTGSDCGAESRPGGSSPIIDRFLVGFFDRTLLGTGAAAIEQNPFDEVTLEVIGS